MFLLQACMNYEKNYTYSEHSKYSFDMPDFAERFTREEHAWNETCNMVAPKFSVTRYLHQQIILNIHS
jgi:hypothetical protein